MAELERSTHSRPSSASSARRLPGPAETLGGAHGAVASGESAARREVLWDAIRAIAIVRVMAWHAWGWAPLSWFAAMPAMFFVAGVLLAQSIERHGVRHTLSSRLRRLLIPFAGYSMAAVAVMFALGWRPGVADLASWVLPLRDPVGSAEAPGLWIPLWYLRAYLWFLLAAGAIAAAVRRMGWLVPLALSGVLAAQQVVAPDIPMAVEDFIAYAPFVAAGMVVNVRRLPSAKVAGTAAVLCGVILVAAMAGGRASTVVNADYAVTALAGAATLGLLLAAASPLRSLAAGSASRLVGWISRRSLSVYLWQGVGLLAADLLVTQRGVRGATGIVAVGLVVAVVTVAAATAAGWLEDLAARRADWPPGRTSTAGAAIAAVALFAAMAVAPASSASARLPPSGLAVVDNAERVEAELDEQSDDEVGETASTVGADVSTLPDALGRSRREQRVADMLGAFTGQHRDALEAMGNSYVRLAVVTADGQEIALRWDAGTGVTPVVADEPIAWLSMTKSATAGWMMRLAEQGIIDVDDPVGTYLPQVPHGDTITLDQLSRHQSGIPSSFDAAWLTSNVGEDARAWLRSGALAFEPGTSYGYSRVGYTLLAWALEEASGVTWQNAMRDMAVGASADQSFAIDEEFAPAGTENRHPGAGSYLGIGWAAGGILASPGDLVRFFNWLYLSGLDESSVDALSSVPESREFGYYGAGVVATCPCRVREGVVRPDFIGHGTATGSFVHHIPTGTTIFVGPEVTLDENGFVGLFFDGELYESVIAALA